jgi:hypothetical protein
MPDVNLPVYEESLEKLLGKIGEKDEKKEHELFEEIMAAVDKTGSVPKAEGSEVGTEGEESEVGAKAEMPPEAESAAQEVVEEAPPAGTVMFECPLCNTLVNEDAKSCPGCGAIFAEDEGEAQVGEGEMEARGAAESTGYAEEQVTFEEAPSEMEPAQDEAASETYYEETPAQVEYAEAEPQISEERAVAAPPEKDKRRFKLGKKRKKKDRMEEEAGTPTAMAEGEAVQAPRRDERSLHKELTSCVSEVKPLLAAARQFEINVFDGRKLIDKAITAGKNRDFEQAISLVKESKSTIENVINQHILDSIQTTQVKITALSKAGGDVGGLEEYIGEVKILVEQGKFVEAIKLARNAADETEKAVVKLKSAIKRKEQSEKGKDVSDMLKSLIELIKSGEQVKVNVKGAKALLTQARVAIKKNELSRAEELLTDAKEDFLRELPKQLADIISNSKPVLYKAKMQGVDIRPSIKLLKEASTALKLNNYLDALEAIKQYKSEMSQYMG